MDPLLLSFLTTFAGIIFGFFLFHHFSGKSNKINVLSKGQFSLYKELWSALLKLQLRGEDLFSEPSQPSLLKFADALKELKELADKDKNILNESDYKELMVTIGNFESYTFDDKMLSEIKESDEIDDKTVRGALNEKDKENYEKVSDKIIESSNDIPKPDTNLKLDPWDY